MELFAGCADTSLNLNVSPSRHMDDADAEMLMEELDRLSSENKKLTETLSHMSESYNALLTKVVSMEKINHDIDEEATTACRKRKGAPPRDDDHQDKLELACKKPCSTTTAKVSRLVLRTEPSDTSLYVRDGYQWRKYGQKVTRDNPSPRAYFKCSFAPACPVKKKVQRSIEDPRVLVATYEGEHNHCSSMGSSQISEARLAVSSPVATMTRTLHPEGGSVDTEPSFLPIVQQMATSLTRDPNFTAALATAISRRINSSSI